MKFAAGTGTSRSYLTHGAHSMLCFLDTHLQWPSQLPRYSSLSSAAVARVSYTFICQVHTSNCFFDQVTRVCIDLASIHFTFTLYSLFYMGMGENFTHAPLLDGGPGSL